MSHIKKHEVGPTIDTAELTRLVDSFVMKGDISGLNPQERSALYIRMCTSLGLNPATQPLAVLKLNGKDVLYVTRGATDQLARLHCINRRITEGPDVRDFCGTKMLYAKCEASMPDGRVETSVATLPTSDLVNGVMKVESKAKRRATLSILGLGMLDEMELETIPARHKQTIEQIDPTTGEVTEPPKPTHAEQIAKMAKASLAGVALYWLENSVESLGEEGTAVFALLLKALPQATPKAWLNGAIEMMKQLRLQPLPPEEPGDSYEPNQRALFGAFVKDLASLRDANVLVDRYAVLWIAHEQFASQEFLSLWRAHIRVEVAHKFGLDAKAATEALDTAIEARRPKPPTDPMEPSKGKRKVKETKSEPVVSDAQTDQQATIAWTSHIAHKGSLTEVQRSHAYHYLEWSHRTKLAIALHDVSVKRLMNLGVSPDDADGFIAIAEQRAITERAA